MIYGYIRVSTDKQTIENQRFEIERFAGQQKLRIDGWIEETISGTVSPSKRNLGKLIEKTKRGDMPPGKRTAPHPGTGPILSENGRESRHAAG